MSTSEVGESNNNYFLLPLLSGTHQLERDDRDHASSKMHGKGDMNLPVALKYKPYSKLHKLSS